MLTLLHRPAALEVIGEATARLTDSMRPRPLSELISAPEGGDRGKPLVLVNDEDELESELNMLLLQDELQRISGVSCCVTGFAMHFCYIVDTLIPYEV